MSKYIIRNCPAILPMTKLCDSENMKKPSDYCINCTDCVIKQVIERCKEDCVKFADGRELRYDTLEDILQLFDIEDVE